MSNYFAVTNVPSNKIYNENKIDLSHFLPDNKLELISHSSLLDNSFKLGNHSFVRAAIRAYCNHYNLEIRPDDVWIAICTQFSNYVNANSDQLRNKLVNFNGKKTLALYYGGSMRSMDYKIVCNDMSNMIAENIKDSNIRDWIIPNFSTTTENDKLVGAATLMSSVKSYFDFKVFFMCNLPGVTLLGSVSDWINIRSRAEKLLEFELTGEIKAWTTLLFHVLDKFIETSKHIESNNKHLIDLQWWNTIANYYPGGSGPSYVSGWITAFCVFNDDGKFQATNLMSPNNSKSSKNKFYNYDWPKIDTNDIPHGYVSVPIKINDNGSEYDATLVAGHIFCDEKENNTISPRLDWVLYAKENNSLI